MKEIKAIIQPAMLSKVIEALKAIADLPGVTENTGFTRFPANFSYLFQPVQPPDANKTQA